MTDAELLQRDIGRLEGRMEMTDALEAMSRRLTESEADRRTEEWQAKTAHVQAKLDAHERRQAARAQARQAILLHGAHAGIGIPDRIARRLAEGDPVLAGGDLVFPVREYISVGEAIDRLRISEPGLFDEPVIAEPHDDEIERYRRDRWGDVPSDE